MEFQPVIVTRRLGRKANGGKVAVGNGAFPRPSVSFDVIFSIPAGLEASVAVLAKRKPASEKAGAVVRLQ
jgi:hypothetical protein